MKSVVGMAAKYMHISLEEMQKFLFRGFRALDPVVFKLQGEVAVDLALNDAKTLGIRVWTSIPADSTHGAAVGADAIRIQFFNFKNGHPMERGKAPIVKRTQNWRDNLKDRIEDVVEKYDSEEEYWESRVR